MDRKTKGRLAEAKAVAYLIENGYEVYIPFSGNSKYDLLIVKDSKVYRVSVKYTAAMRNNSSWSVELRQISRRKNYINIDKFNNTSFDYLVVYIGPKDKVVLIEAKQLKTRSVDIKI